MNETEAFRAIYNAHRRFQCGEITHQEFLIIARTAIGTYNEEQAKAKEQDADEHAYRTRPKVFLAWQWDETLSMKSKLQDKGLYFGAWTGFAGNPDACCGPMVVTVHGNVRLNKGNWIVKSENGFRAYMEDEFAAEFESLKDVAMEADAQMLLVKACEHIAMGDEGWQKLRNECPSTAAVASVRDALNRCVRALTELYKDTEGYADGAPDASPHDKLCNYVSSLAKEALDLQKPDPMMKALDVLQRASVLVIQTWDGNAGRFQEQMGDTNPRFTAMRDAMEDLKGAIRGRSKAPGLSKAFDEAWVDGPCL